MTADLLAMVPVWERELAELDRKAQAYRQMIAGVRALNGHASEVLQPIFLEQNGQVFVAQPLDKRGPRGRAAVLAVMRTEPGRLWKVVDVKREVLRRGWAPSPKAVEATLKRLRETGEVETPRYGYYKLARHASAINEEATEEGVRPALAQALPEC